MTHSNVVHVRSQIQQGRDPSSGAGETKLKHKTVVVLSKYFHDKTGEKRHRKCTNTYQHFEAFFLYIYIYILHLYHVGTFFFF